MAANTRTQILQAMALGRQLMLRYGAGYTVWPDNSVLHVKLMRASGGLKTEDRDYITKSARKVGVPKSKLKITAPDAIIGDRPRNGASHLRLQIVMLIACLSLLSACGSEPRQAQVAHPGYKVGKPYEVSGEWYYPRENYSYDETGIASWYGQGFHGERTANGEIFNKDELTAAHPTLPMPSLARVTNLDNGRSIVVRINDRGPFEKGRLIDVSQRGADLLGFEKTGTAKVRVQVLADESKAIADAMRHYGSPAPIQVASAPQAEQPPPPMETAPIAGVSSQELEPPPSNTVQTAPKPVHTTAAIHQQLVQTQPVPQVVQLPVTSHNRIFVQAGAFKNRDNATRLQQHLAAVGHATVSEAAVNGVKFYRVRVGPIADVAQADGALKRVTHAGVAAARIIVD